MAKLPKKTLVCRIAEAGRNGEDTRDVVLDCYGEVTAARLNYVNNVYQEACRLVAGFPEMAMIGVAPKTAAEKAAAKAAKKAAKAAAYVAHLQSLVN